MRLPGKMLRWLGSGVITVMAITWPVSSSAPEHRSRPDPRVYKLEAFFARYRCPEPHYTQNYLTAADRHGVDYRLLPAISLIESTCGAFQRFNNHWGWNNAETGFDSVATGINHIIEQLAQGRAYRSRTLDDKLLAYNQNPSYRDQIKRIMKQIDSQSPTE